MNFSRRVLCTVSFACLFWACGDEPAPDHIPAPAVPGGPAETVLFSGAIYTVDPQQSWAESLAIRAGEIVFVGDDAGAQAYVSPGTKTVDLEGRMVLPGFHDSHMHAESASVFVNKCNLYGLPDKQAVIDKLTQCAAADSDRAWVLGEGWLPGLQVFSKEELDQIVSDRPMYLAAMDGHHALMNSKGLEVVGITAETPDPVAGIIHRNDAGEPSGLLIESAMWLPKPHLPVNSEADQLQILQAAMREANRFGITSIVEAWETPELDPIWRQLRQRNELTTRVTLALYIDENWDEDIDTLAARRITDDPMLQATQVKLLVDGVTENLTAAVKEPYIGTDDNRGFMYFTQEQLNDWIPLLEDRGLQIHAHTLGDRSMAAVLDALEKSRELRGEPNDRPTFIHCYLIDPADYPRLLAANASVNFTMLWRQLEPLMVELNQPILGAERLARLMPMAEAADMGLIVTGASDWYVTQIDPLASIAAGLTGKAVPSYRSQPYEPDSQPVMPGRRPSLDTLIAAYTINGAHAAKTDHFTGSIETGKRADLVILERNLFEIPAEEIYGTEVTATLLDGRVVFGALPGYPPPPPVGLNESR